MSYVSYCEKQFRRASLEMIDTINQIIDEYDAQGFVLTVRQLYYQLVARDIISNNLKEYKRVASLLNDARLAGLVSWSAIEDRTREFIRRSRWKGGAEILDAVADQFHMDLWEGQDRRVFVLVEKEALVGVLEGVCHELDIPLLAARGYPSVSVVREFVERDIARASRDGQDSLILHLGDHDPSGIDMTRDLTDRIALFLHGDASEVEVRRIALNMDQIEEQRPPENPAKTTDSRFDAYRRKFGSSSWELDALSPKYLAALVRKHALREIDDDVRKERVDAINAVRDRIRTIANDFED